jgi:hypothetical protein
LRCSVTYLEHYNENYKKTDYYPKFEIAGNNYKLSEDGKVSKTKDSDVDMVILKEILERSKKAHEDYKNFRMVGRVDTVKLVGAPTRLALPEGKVVYQNDDDEDEHLSF